MRDTLRRIGVTETDFIRECDASFKQGSTLQRAGATAATTTTTSIRSCCRTATRRRTWSPAGCSGTRSVPFADLVSFQPHLCAQGKAPKQAATPEYAAVANYAYHLDAGKFGVFLRKHCIGAAGRAPCARPRGRHRMRTPTATSPRCRPRSRRARAATCSSTAPACNRCCWASTTASPFVSQKHVLFNDTALALQVPYADDRRARSPRRPSPPRRAAAGSGTSACRRGAASATSIPARTPPTTRPSASCAPTSRGPAAAGSTCAPAQAHASSPAIGGSSGIATASPSACRPASSNRWKPRRWRW